jgi:hypothetical protein
MKPVGVGHRQRIVQHTSITVTALGIGGILYKGISREEPAQFRIVNPAIHVNQTHGLFLEHKKSTPCWRHAAALGQLQRPIHHAVHRTRDQDRGRGEAALNAMQLLSETAGLVRERILLGRFNQKVAFSPYPRAH